jgi:hypothetical protein
MSVAWKRHERETARQLNGQRNSRGADFSQSIADVEHSLFSIECKYRKQLPQWLREGIEQASQYDQNKLPVLVLKEKGTRGSLVVLRMKDFSALFGSLPEQSE